MKLLIAHFFCVVLSVVMATASVPQKPDTILGAVKICPDTERQVYKVNPVLGVTTYEWTLPAGVTGTSIVDSIELMFDASFAGGMLKVKAGNQDGWSETCTLLLFKGDLPARVGKIFGEPVLCPEAGTATFSVEPALNATSYEWIIADGFTGYGSTNTITINYTPNATPGTLAVRGVNDCGSGEESRIMLTFSSSLQPPGPITGPGILEQYGMITVSVPYDEQAEIYQWTATEGLNITGFRNSCLVSANGNTSPGQYYISVTAIGKCAERTSESFTVNVVPASPKHGVWDNRFAGSLKGHVNDLAVYKGAVYVCGTALAVGSKHGKIMKWDGFTWDSVTTGINQGNIETLEVSGNRLFAGGAFQDAGGNINADNLIWFDGVTWHPVDNSPDSNVKNLHASNGKLIASGDFTKSGDNNIAYHALIDGTRLTHVLDTNYFEPNSNIIVPSDRDTYYVSGYLRNKKNDEFSYMSEICDDGEIIKLEQREYTLIQYTRWVKDGCEYDTPVENYEYIKTITDTLISYTQVFPHYEHNQLLVSGNTLFAVGKFLIVNKENDMYITEGLVSFTRRNREKWGTDYIVKWYGVNGECKAMSIEDNHLVVSGNFTQVKDVDGSVRAKKGLARLNLFSNNWSDYDNKPQDFNENLVFNKIKKYDNTIYFITSGYLPGYERKGWSENLITRGNGQWKQLANLGPGGEIRKIMPVPGCSKRVLVIGDFALPNDTLIRDIAYWDEDTGWLSYGNDELLSNIRKVTAAVYHHDQLYIAAELVDFTRVIARKDVVGLTIIGTTNDDIHDLCYLNGLYAGGRFNHINQIAGTSYVAKWDGNQWLALAGGLPNYVNSLSHDGTVVYAGGDFYDVGGDSNFDFIARWDGIKWENPAPFSRLNYTVYKVFVRKTDAATDIFVGGPFGLFQLVNNYWTSFQNTSLPRYFYVNDLTFNGDIPYAFGFKYDEPSVMRWNGKNWNTMPENICQEIFSGVFCNGKLVVGGRFGNGDKGTVMSNFGVFYPEDCSFPAPVSSIKLLSQKNGNKYVCYGDSIFRLIAETSFLAEGFEWKIPFDAEIVGTPNKDTITVRIKKNFWGGEFLVYSKNDCGYAPPAKLYVNMPLQPDIYIDTQNNLTEFCAGTRQNKIEVYSNCFDKYTWTLPSGFVGNSSTGTLIFDLSPDAVSGTIVIHGECDCGSVDTTLLIKVKALPVACGLITGPLEVFSGQKVVFRIPHVSESLRYEWILPTGFSGESNADTIEVLIGQDAVDGMVKVRNMTDCGAGEESGLQVFVNPNTGLTILDKKRIKLYPSPVKYALTIELEDEYQINRLEIYNLEGELMQFMDKPVENNIVVNQLKKGVYFMKIMGENYTLFERFIKD